jgi:UDP-N-acetylmuramyl tripeptide synthase
MEIDGCMVRLLLAKNPASWTETLHLVRRGRAPIVICVNARGPDGLDTSWLWDVPFEHLAGRTIVASGERHWDLALRLQTAGVEHLVIADPLAAVSTAALSGAAVELVATYTAFHQVLDRLGVKW